MNPTWTDVDHVKEDAGTGIGHVIWFLLENGFEEAAAAVETEFRVSV